MSGPDINALMARAARQAAKKREADRGNHPGTPKNRGDAPTPGVVDGGERLSLGEDRNGALKWFLQGRPLSVGDTVELYTNRANGWIRGRFEWSGLRHERPRIAVNIWNPHGEPDPDGLPPWVGELEAAIPRDAICRLPSSMGRGRASSEG